MRWIEILLLVPGSALLAVCVAEVVRNYLILSHEKHVYHLPFVGVCDMLSTCLLGMGLALMMIAAAVILHRLRGRLSGLG
jgi:hypothetical protein